MNEYLFESIGGKNYLCGYNGDESDLTLPDSYNGQTYEIAKEAFAKNRSIKRIYITELVTHIGERAFFCSNIEDVIISSGAKSLGKEVFAGCENLKSVTIYADMERLSIGAFRGCGALEYVILPATLEEIDDYAFASCTFLDKLLIPNGVKRIGCYAFGNCVSFKNISLPTSLSVIDESAFQGCESLDSISLPSSLETISHQAFYGCKRLTTLIAAEASKLKISDTAFKNCYSLVEAVLSEDNIDRGITLNLPKSVDQHADASIIEKRKNLRFYARQGKACLFGYTGNDNTIILPGAFRGLEYSIHPYAFADYKRKCDVIIPEGVVAIGDFAFYNCEYLNSVHLPISITKIGEDVFSCCKNLTEVYYSGTPEDWYKIVIHQNNPSLEKIKIHCKG